MTTGALVGRGQQGAAPRSLPLTRCVRIYLVGAILVVGGWVVLAVVTPISYPTSGPGDLAHATTYVPAQVRRAAAAQDSYFRSGTLRAAAVPSGPGGPLWVVYSLDPSNGVQAATAIDALTFQHVTAAARLLPTGAWPYLGFVKGPTDWGLGGVVLAVILFAVPRWALLSEARKVLARRERPPSAIGRLLAAPSLVAASLVCALGFLTIWWVPGWNRARKLRWAFGAALAWAVVVAAISVSRALGEADRPSVAAVSYVVAASALAWGYGWTVLRPGGRARLDQLATEPGAALPSWGPGRPEEAGGGAPAGEAQPQTARPAQPQAAEGDHCRVRTCDQLPDFSSVGGMAGLKAELTESVGRLLAFPDEAADLGVDMGGLLLHGPPGCGKTFLVEAMAGEYGLTLVSLSQGDLASPYRGESSRLVRQAFARARAEAPSVLFLDELDGMARRRDVALSSDDRSELTTLLEELDAVRHRRDIVVAAATNDLGAIDPAVLRPGRFDRQVQVGLPDRAAREAIVAAQLASRRRVDPDIDLGRLADRTAGLTPAGIALMARRAAQVVLDQVATGHEDRRITTDDLLAALQAVPADRPTVEGWTWARLVLAPAAKRELQELQALIEHPERVAALGLPPLSGALLYGPPGTGKTTVARVLAAEAKCSFYPLIGSDLVSKWVGETERNLADAFSRARDHVPAIVFIDEIDALAPARGMGSSNVGDRWVSQLLQEIDGLGARPGVFVLGATNRLDILDPALVRGGRLSRRIELPLPALAERAELLRLLTAAMPLGPDVDLAAVAAQTEGWSGADLGALCQQAGIEALIRAGPALEATSTAGPAPVITMADLALAGPKVQGG